jgi:hypothetical protein
MSRIGIDVYACYHHCCALDHRESLDELSGRTLGEDIAEAQVWNDDVIRTIDNAVYAEGALAVLRDNLGRRRGAADRRRGPRGQRGYRSGDAQRRPPGPDEPAIL